MGRTWHSATPLPPMGPEASRRGVLRSSGLEGRFHIPSATSLRSAARSTSWILALCSPPHSHPKTYTHPKESGIYLGRGVSEGWIFKESGALGIKNSWMVK